MKKTQLTKIVLSIFAVIVMLVILIFAGRIFEEVPADEIVIIQHPISGKLDVHTKPGTVAQYFGTVTKYPKSFHMWFSAKEDQGGKEDQSIKVRFNDGGDAHISGSVRIDLPLEREPLIDLHIRYSGINSIKQDLIRTVFEKAVYMTGPLMSSKESYAEKRSMLISAIEDQAKNGVYRTTSKEVKVNDPLTNKEKTVTLVELIPNPTAPDGFERQEESPLNTFRIKAYNLSINKIQYNAQVENQIAAQQKAIMDVQTAMAESKKAEQDVITVEQKGKAKAVAAKWEEEEKKAKEIVKANLLVALASEKKKEKEIVAQQELEVAKLAKQAAEYTKQRDILLGEGESAKRRLIMEADGALEKKLEVYREVMVAGFNNLGKYKLVPDSVVSFGGNGNSSANNGVSNISEFLNIITASAAQSLQLNMDVSGADGKQNNKVVLEREIDSHQHHQ